MSCILGFPGEWSILMEYSDLYKPENVMLLAKLTDKSLAMIAGKKKDPSPDEIDLVRRGLFRKQNEVVNG
jgi:hypothetical protein